MGATESMRDIRLLNLTVRGSTIINYITELTCDWKGGSNCHEENSKTSCIFHMKNSGMGDPCETNKNYFTFNFSGIPRTVQFQCKVTFEEDTTHFSTVIKTHNSGLVISLLYWSDGLLLRVFAVVIDRIINTTWCFQTVNRISGALRGSTRVRRPWFHYDFEANRQVGEDEHSIIVIRSWSMRNMIIANQRCSIIIIRVHLQSVTYNDITGK